MSKKIEIAGHQFTVRQVSLTLMRDIFEGSVKFIEGLESIDLLLLSDLNITLTEIVHMSDATPEQLKAMTPDEVAELARAAIAANERYFVLRKKLEEIGERVLAEQEAANG